MNDKTLDNPAAFPLFCGDAENINNNIGMTLRDYFAGQALVGLLANSAIAKEAVKIGIKSDANQSWHGETAYKFADAALRERMKYD